MQATADERKALGQALLKPSCVALVGVSDDFSKTAGRPLRFLRAAGYKGLIYPINPNRSTVQGEKAYPDLASLPEVPEHVFVLTPTESVLSVVEECARLGVKVVSVLASGFSESGPEGVAREEALRAVARRSALRILGPSSLGVIHPQSGLVLTANAAFAEPEMPAGKVFVASHSGSMIGALVSRGKARGVGFAGLVSRAWAKVTPCAAKQAAGDSALAMGLDDQMGAFVALRVWRAVMGWVWLSGSASQRL